MPTMKYRLYILLFVTFSMVFPFIGWSWNLCDSDKDYDQDIDGQDLQITIQQSTSGVDISTLTKLASNFGKTDCTPFPLTITSPFNGETVHSKWILVEGNIAQSDTGEVGITVNGVPASIYQNHFVINHIPLNQGNNTIEVKASNGEVTVSKTVTVNAIFPDNYARLDAHIESGTADLLTKLYVNQSFASQTPATITSNGPNTVTFIENSPTQFDTNLTVPGIYYFTVNSQDSESNVYTDTISVVVYDEVDLDAKLRAKWLAMTTSLSSGNIDVAASHMATGVRNNFKYNFELLKDYLANVTLDLHDMELVRISDSRAVYNILGDQNGQTYSFIVIFLKDSDGIWRIHFF